jgi:hypothetical protein
MTMIADQAKAAAMVDQLEKRGFVVDKNTADQFPARLALCRQFLISSFAAFQRLLRRLP